MTEIDPTHIIKDNDCIYYRGEKYQKVKEPPRMELERTGKVSIVFYDKKPYYRIEYGDEFHYTVWWRRTKQEDTSQLSMITDKETERLLEGMYFNDVKKGVVDEPDWYDEVEWDEKDNPKPMDEVMDRLIKKYQSQKLWNMLRDELGYSVDCCDEIVDLVEKWLPKEQSAAGSQNVNTELLVDGHNHCLQKMREMLR
jgi:hypothetical protein